jgi:ferredoxin-NADP reductase
MSEAASGAGKRPASIARIERIHEHAFDTRSLFLRTIEGRRLSFVPGQFISVTIPLPAGSRVRAYSIASSPEDDEPFEICFNRVPGGEGAAYLFDLKVGDTLAFTGPFGTCTLDRPPQAETVFIAEGTAIAPVRPMIRRAMSVPSHPPLHLLYAASDPDHILYRNEIEEWARRDGRFGVEILTPGPAPDLIYGQLAQEAERRWVNADGDRSRHFYICGVGKGVLELRDLLRHAGYERRAVRYEQW